MLGGGASLSTLGAEVSELSLRWENEELRISKIKGRQK